MPKTRHWCKNKHAGAWQILRVPGTETIQNIVGARHLLGCVEKHRKKDGFDVL